MATAKANNEQTPLEQSADLGQVISSLVKEIQTNTNVVTQLHKEIAAIRKDHTEKLELLQRENQQLKMQMQSLQSLVWAIGAQEHGGSLALVWFEAVRTGDYQKLTALIKDKGIDCNFQWRSKHDYTALHYCAEMGLQKEMVKFLLTNGARVDEKDEHGATPLMKTCQLGKRDLFLELVQYGADVNARNKYGMTPLMYAASNNREEVVMLLLQQPQFNSLNNVDSSGKTALHYATEKSYNRVVQLLKSYNNKGYYEITKNAHS